MVQEKTFLAIVIIGLVLAGVLSGYGQAGCGLGSFLPLMQL